MKYKNLLMVPIMLFLLSCKGPQGPQGPTGPSGADALTDPTVQPKVIWTFPSYGQIGPITDFNNLVSIRFNKILDVSTLSRSIQFSPSGPGYVSIDTNDISLYPTADLIIIDLHYYLWAIDQTYTITVLTSLKDINGNSLSAPYRFSFKPEPYFRVITTYPKNGATNVSISNEIELVFNNSIDPSYISSISISPPISGSWDFVYNVVYLSTSNTLNPNTVYVVTVGTGMKDAQGHALPSSYSFSFRTESIIPRIAMAANQALKLTE